MENLMPKVAEMLGVELRETFKVHCNEFSYRLNEYGVEYFKDGIWKESNALSPLLSGDIRIIKKPWKPKAEERFYYINSLGNIHSHFWSNNNMFYILLHKTGNLFKTKEEIIQEDIDKYVAFCSDDARVFEV